MAFVVWYPCACSLEHCLPPASFPVYSCCQGNLLALGLTVHFPQVQIWEMSFFFQDGGMNSGPTL
jgi:hypothetical protein